MDNSSPTAQEKRWWSLSPLVAGGLALLLYASTAAPWLTWANDGADGGDLIAASMTRGVPHPSGYPTYCLLGRLFASLPLGPTARRYNLFSATMAAASVALVCLCALKVLRKTAAHETWIEAIIALLVALAWATSPVLWSQATITEVYALQAFFTSACLYLALRDDLLVHPQYWALLGLLFGLGLGTHLTIVLMLPGLVVLLWAQAKRNRLFALALGVLLGASVYLYLPLAARGHPPINWGDPRTWAGFWWVVSGAPYHGYLFGLPLADLPSRIGAWVDLWGQQYTWFGLALALTGLWSWIETGSRRRALAMGLIFGAHALYAVTYDTADSYVYLIPTYLLTALWMAEGARVVYTDYIKRRKLERIGLGIGLSLLVAIPLWSIGSHHKSPDPFDAQAAPQWALDLSHDHEARQWTDAVLQMLPHSALVITGEDRHTFTLDYAIWVEGQRQDLCVVDGELLQYPWYVRQISERYPLFVIGQAPLTPRELILMNLGRCPVYLVSARKELEQVYEMKRQILGEGHAIVWEITAQK